MTPPLLTSFELGPYKLKNRVLMAPLTRKHASIDFIPTEIMTEYYKQRATAGLIISEATNISLIGTGTQHSPGIYTKEQIEAWKKITETVHQEGGLIYCQLWHVGRHTHPLITGGLIPVAPSPVKENGFVKSVSGPLETVTPREIEIDEIKQTVLDYATAAQNAIEAGFDGVEIHGANGYLIHQFLADGVNKRIDEYGGSLENRARFALEVVSAVSQQIGSERTGIRLSPSGKNMDVIDSNPFEIFSYLINKLNDYNLAYLHLLEPWTPIEEGSNYPTEVIKTYKPFYQGNIIANLGFDFDSGNKIITDGYADMVSFGKLFISNPDLPLRFATGAKLTPWNKDTYYTSTEEGYTDYPSLDT